MCGIAGWFGAPGAEPKEEWVRRILEEQSARGPDHTETRRCVGARGQALLGHNRLAIIDLSAAANQPLSRRGEGRWITFNGEIYNYLELRAELAAEGVGFETRSDTEVLLAAWHRWGSAALPRCNGMFAFGLFDERDGALTLVRDRFGVKPLYYALAADALLFGSSPGALARCLGRGPDLEYAERGLATGIYEDDTERSPYLGVLALPAGCLLHVTMVDGRPVPRIERYYALEERVAAVREELAAASLPALVERTRVTLESAVQLRLRSDVPVGVSLSGGIDSSSVAALAAGGGNVAGFTFGASDEPRSEGPVVAELAARFGIGMHTVPSARGRVLADAFDATLAAQDAPFGGCPVIAQFTVCRAARAAGVKVLLGGQGGDEAFMGYHKFKIFRLRELLGRRDYVGALQVGWGSLLSLGASGFGARGVLRQYGRFRRNGDRPERSTPAGRRPAVGLGYDPGTPLWERQARDITALSLPTLLRYEDRNSMGNSVESRLPFVDFRLVEFGLALPSAAKIRRGYGKWILREAMGDRLPASVGWARGKRGFDADHEYAIRAGLGAVLRDRLDEVRGEWEGLGAAVAPRGESFPDERFVRDPRTINRVVTAIWLGQRLAGIGPLAGARR